MLSCVSANLVSPLVFLALIIAGFAVAAWRVNRTASLLFLPCLIGVSDVAALTAPIWSRNPAAA